MKIGVIPDSFLLPFKEAAALAAKMGVDGLQPFVTRGEMAPENLTKQDRADLLKYTKGLGLEFSALCADFGMNFKTLDNDDDVKRTMSMMDLAVDLDTHIITTHIGKVPEDENAPEFEYMVKSIEKLGKYGDKIGVCFATETGPEMSALLKKVLDRADTKSARVNLDPANLFMCAGENPVNAVRTLGSYIVHTHAKDGQMQPDGSWKEYRLGDGGVPFFEYISTLKAVGYDGYLTIEREAGETRMADIEHAIKLLKSILERI